MMRYLLLTFCFSLTNYAQVSQVDFKVLPNKQLEITYQLTQAGTISAQAILDGNTIPIKTATGDIGKNISPGPKSIRWDVLEDVKSLTGELEIEISYRPAGAPTLKMVYVEPGTFTMGCTSEQSNCDSDEKPTHQVTLTRGYYIGQYEVTQAQWERVMGSNPSRFDNCGPNCPVEKVSWNDIQEFLQKLNQMTGKNYRLPTEAQWEFAARGGTKSRGYKYAGSNSVGAVAWYDDNSDDETHPVGQREPNELGLYDMSGNVWEWCADWYGDYSSASQTNPTGPSSGSSRVLRGGSRGSYARNTRVPLRHTDTPGGRFSNGGFRLFLFP